MTRLAVSPVPGWPGARRFELAGVEAVVGDVDAVLATLSDPAARDAAEAGPRRGDARAAFLRRRAILRWRVGLRLGAPPGAVELGYDAAGAPEVLAPAGPAAARPAAFVSVSARGRLAGFATGDVPVGIDLEPSLDPGPLDAALHPRERARIAAAPDGKRALLRLRHWTAKEAYLKATRTGLLRDPAAVEILSEGEGGFGIADGGSDPARRGAVARGAWALPVFGGGVAVVALCALYEVR